MPINPELITKEIMDNTIKREIYPEIQVIARPKNGKVRTVYDTGDDNLLLVTSDNISTHDVVHKRQVYAKGDNLNAISAFYFDETSSNIITVPIINFLVTAASGDLKNAVKVTIETDNDGTGWSNGVIFARRVRVYGYACK